jgi:fumarate hydratase, class II
MDTVLNLPLAISVDHIPGLTMTTIRIETDSLGKVEVESDKLWGAQTQRSREHFSIGEDLILHEMIAHAVLKKESETVN